MSTRLVYLFALIACLGAAYLYMNQDKIDSKKASSQSRYDYWADDVKATQTNSSGQADFQLNAAGLVHDPQTDILQLNDLQARLKHVGADNGTFDFSANKATWQQSAYQLRLLGDVTVTRQPVSGASTRATANNELTFKTQTLQANTKTKKLVGDKPVTLTMNNSFIRANALKADLNRGEYQFDKLQAQHAQ